MFFYNILASMLIASSHAAIKEPLSFRGTDGAPLLATDSGVDRGVPTSSRPGCNPGKYENDSWNDLPTHVKAAAKFVGYIQGTWDAGGRVEADEVYWADITRAAKKASREMDCDKECWDNCHFAPLGVHSSHGEGDSDPLPMSPRHFLIEGPSSLRGKDGAPLLATDRGADKCTPGKYDDYLWVNLPARAEVAAKFIGYTQPSWDAGGRVEADEYYWADITEEAQVESRELGCDQACWDNCRGFAPLRGTRNAFPCRGPCKKPPRVCKGPGTYEGYSWDYLPARAKVAAKFIGYIQQSWDEHGRVEADEYDWADITEEAQDESLELGCNQACWDGCRHFKPLRKR